MNTILRSKMEREIEPNWECDYGGLIGQPYARVLAVDNGDVVFRRGNCAPATSSLRAITHVRPPGGEWLEVVDDPKVGSVWQCRRHHDDWYAVVLSVDEQRVTYDSLGREAVDQKCDVSKWHDRWELVDSSRIVEGMDGGRRRRFVKAEVRIVKSGEDVPIQVLLPLNFIDPAPSITPATPSTSSVHTETELEGGTKRLATCKESFQVDPLSWDANPPMVGDIVAGNTLHRPSLIGYVDTCGKVSLCCSARGIPHDEFVAAYRRLALSPLHKEAGRRHDRTLC